MPDRTLDAWNRMILGLVKNGYGEEALAMLSKLKVNGIVGTLEFTKPIIE